MSLCISAKELSCPVSCSCVIQTHTHSNTESTPPENFTVTSITNTSASFQWSHPLDANGIISAYHIIVSDGAAYMEMITTISLEITFSKLKPFSNYIATVFATNGFGNGTSTELDFMTFTGSK